MKAITKIILLVCFITTASAFAQTKTDSLGLPGDNFDLPGALELFKKSSTPEEFEKALNKNDNEVNNLDLNGDGEVDYVKVVDNKDGNAHTMVLQVAVAKNEIQDVAVIEIEKTKDGNAHIQIVGDEELYGKDYIIEPKDEKTASSSSEKIKSDAETDDVYKSKDEKSNFNNNTNSNTVYYNNDPNVYVNVYYWPMVQYVYAPAYIVWVSPWYWGYYPGWWSPWRPIYWRNHYWRAHHYHHHYHHCNFYRSPNVHKGYYGRRTSSETVRGHQRSGFYAEKQITYKDNVKPGRKYNSLPADPEKKIGKRNSSEENMNQPKKGGYKAEEYNQPKGGGRNNNSEPNESKSEPRKNNSQPKEIYNSPKNNQQPKYENTQPKKNPGMGTPQNNFPKQNNGGGRNIGGSQGGGMKSGGGGNGGGGRNTGGGGGGRNHK